MAQAVIPWSTGTGNITLTFSGSGDDTVTVTSDENSLDVSRSQVITVRTIDGLIRRTVTVTQEAGSNFKTSDGKRLRLSNGLYFNVRNESV